MVVSLVTVVAQAGILHVGGGQTYATIQAAFNAAVTGDEVVIHAGTYTTQAGVVGKSNLYIHNATGEKVVINGGLYFNNSSEGSTVEGLYIKPTGCVGIQNYYVGGRGNTYKNLTFFNGDNGRAAIYGDSMYGNDNLVNITIYNCDYALSYNYASSTSIKNVIIANSRSSGALYSYNGSAITYSNFWMNPTTSGYEGTGMIEDSTCISLDPLFYSTDPSSPYFLWLAQNSPSSGTGLNGVNMGSQLTIPEPATITLFGLAGLALLKRNRSK
jgi:hypothetical protein